MKKLTKKEVEGILLKDYYNFRKDMKELFGYEIDGKNVFEVFQYVSQKYLEAEEW